MVAAEQTPNARTESTPKSNKPPNILFVMADQMAAPILPMYDPNSVVQMPNLMDMAKDSVVFDSAYCNAPLCAPSRFAMVTGQLPHRIGAYDNASQLSSEEPTFAHYLRSVGYHTSLAGKMHFIGADQLHGYEQRLTSDIYPGDFGWSVNWDTKDLRLDYYHNMASVTDAGVCVRSNQIDYDEEVMYRAKNYLYDHTRRNPDQPFFLTVALTHPHDPYTTRKEWWDLYEGVDIPLPKDEPEPANLEPHAKRLQKVIDLEDKPLTDEQKKRARRAYFGNCSYVDDNVGQLRKVLDECDLTDDTIIIFSGDHGDHLGERSLWYKMTFYEMSARIPLMVYAPKHFSPRRVKESVSSLDYLPTFVDIATGCNAEQVISKQLPMDGQSLFPYLQGGTGADLVRGEYMGEGTISPLFMVRQGKYKFIYCPTDPLELYDVEQDPLEKRNLARLPQHRDLAASFLYDIKSRIDIQATTDQVLKSQRSRRVCHDALSKGVVTHWDFQPFFDTKKQYIRNNTEGILDDFEAKARYPMVVHSNEGNIVNSEIVKNKDTPAAAVPITANKHQNKDCVHGVHGNITPPYASSEADVL
ncbi:putative Choline sulfatase [Taphrina deformans PYCC 5710]|uniref:Choline sulfatase n=1 Tax=Taphrina deformans (strain PYCC 5710 / ATCC 11124 / CBS 356.35 / IMI 108563 / JCM 9778 / NBRC 8474) TaxID=1097556 RepID=R4X8G3_TAPDE|nr:putative Choline sulfatase [Taphrina deformans PYCC 5710]|eukprot:CCG81586.1 putative Choline sulfatase [Taphrina deformans PYCC 5710]